MVFNIFVLFFIILTINCKDLFEDFYKDAEKLMEKMTMEEKIGQMFMPRYGKSRIDDVKLRYAGGFVLFAKDFESPRTDQQIIGELDELNRITKHKLIFAVDEEGGKVTRVSMHRRKEGSFPSPQDLYKEGGINRVLQSDKEKIELLRKYKLNVNYAPVADYTTNTSAFIYARSLGQDINKTSQYISDNVKFYIDNKFTCCIKHFPGYGGSLDSHKDEVIDDRPYEEFEKQDFLPFDAGIMAGVPMVMVTHNKVLCKDEKFPSSLSKTWHDILRQKFGYTGLILTDDLAMGAIVKYKTDVPPSVLAVNAGNDMLLSSNFSTQFNEVVAAYKEGKIKNETINTACKRVLAYKYAYGIIEKPKDGDDGDTNSKTKPYVYILIGVGSAILIGLIIFLIVKFGCKKENKNDTTDINTKDGLVDNN